MLVSSRTTRASEPRAITTSLSARSRSPLIGSLPPRRIRPSSAMRGSSVVPARDEQRRATRSSSLASTFDRKPTLPTLMPSRGTSSSMTARAARRNVPSPPRTTRTSVLGSSRWSASRSAAWRRPVVDPVHRPPSRRRAPGARRRRRWSGCRRTRSGATARRVPAIGRRLGARRSGRAGGAGTRGCPPARGSAMGSRRAAPGPTPTAASATSRTTRAWTAGSRTTPPLVSPRPASNWGFTSGTSRRPRRRSRGDRRRARAASEMNETSTVASETGSGSVVAGQRPGVRPLHGDHARIAPERLCELPAARRRARRHGCAPRCSSTSVKPPVEAPTSRHTRPAGSTPNASSAAASLWPPRLTYGSGTATSTACPDRRGHPASDRAAPRHRRRPAPGRRAAAPGHASAIRRGHARR